MYRNGFFFLLMSMLLSSCFFHHKPVAVSEKNVVPKRLHHVKLVKHCVSGFSQVKIEGHIDASVHSGYAKPMVILRGDPRDLQQVVVETHGDTLLVNMGAGYPRHGPVKAEIRTRYINYLAYDGVGNLSGTKLRSNDLILDLNNNGITNLDGYLMLRKLTVRGQGLYKIGGVHSQYLVVDIDEEARVEMRGNTNLNDLIVNGDGRFSLYWVKGPCLRVRAHGHPAIQLAGVVSKLDVELHDRAMFEGRYLRADRVFAKTFDKSVARISAVHRQHTLASDQSDIYFYNLSEMRTDFMAYDGSVLDMRSWDLRGRKEYTYLNKWP